MGLLDSLTVAIAGPTAVKQSQERGLERKYSHVPQSLKSVTDSLPEPTPNELPVRHVPSPKPASLRSHRTESDSLLSSRPQLYRSQSEVPKSVVIRTQDQYPPDITTMELTPEQLKRTYSSSNVWDEKTGWMPPLPEMKGFGKYRAAVNADKEWHIARVKRSMSNLDSLVRDLDNLSPGLSDEEWEQCKQEQLTRRSSIITSQSTGSNSSCGVDFVVDGTRISRGFSPSTISSTHSSFRDLRANIRKDSNLSITSMSSEHRRSSNPRASHYLSIQGSENNLSRIASLRRMQSAIQSTGRKIEQPCEFGIGGDPESALASDASDIDDEDDDENINETDADWADMIELPKCQNSRLTQKLKGFSKTEPLPPVVRTRTTSENAQKRRASRNGIDRSKTVRAVSRKRTRHRASRSGGLQNPRPGNEQPEATASNKADVHEDKICYDSATTDVTLLSQEIDDTIDDFTLPTAINDETPDDFPEGNSKAKELKASDEKPLANANHERQGLRRRRNRSSTAVRIDTTGLPLLKPVPDDQD